VRDASAAVAALIVEFAARKGWTNQDPLLLTTGVRDAYENGLELVSPVAGGVLGYCMTEVRA